MVKQHGDAPAMSNKTKWTQGPWEINGIAIESGFEVIAYLREPAHYHGDIRHGHKDEVANAHLIKTAPDLYEALDGLLSELDSTPEISLSSWGISLQDARTALAKARGEV